MNDPVPADFATGLLVRYIEYCCGSSPRPSNCFGDVVGTAHHAGTNPRRSRVVEILSSDRG